MRKALTLALAGFLLASSLPGCILTPIHRERRQVTRWNWENVNFKEVKAIPASVFGVLFTPVAWVADAVIVNPIDSYKGAVVDVHYTNWSDEDETAQQSYVKSPARSDGSLVLGVFDFAWRANSPIQGPHNPDQWKHFWNEHIEVTEVGSAE